MKKTRYTESQIMSILKQAEDGMSVADLCREHGMSSASFYGWRTKYSDINISAVTRLKELEIENKLLRKMYVEACLRAEIEREATEKRSSSMHHKDE